MIIGAHSIIYSTNPEADRAFLRDHLPAADHAGMRIGRREVVSQAMRQAGRQRSGRKNEIDLDRGRS